MQAKLAAQLCDVLFRSTMGLLRKRTRKRFSTGRATNEKTQEPIRQPKVPRISFLHVLQKLLFPA